MDQPVQLACADGKFRGAVLTIFNVESYDSLPQKLSYFAYGAETCPTTGRKHLQAFAYAINSLTLAAWKKIFPSAHIERMHGTFAQNEKYCSKQSNLTSFGVAPQSNGKRRDLTTVCERILAGESLKDVSADYPTVYVQYHNGLRSLRDLHSEPYEHDTVRGTWIWGVAGAGKSHYARTKFEDRYIKPQNKWFDGYRGQKSIILEDYDCGKCLGHYLKIWADRWSCTGEVKGGTVQLQHHYFVVTSNYSIEEMFPDDVSLQAAIRRRFEVIHLEKVYKFE